MNVMVIGSGGREYSIGLALKKDKNVEKLFFAPGNGATTRLGENVSFEDFENLALFAKENHIGLTIVGPETALVEGVVDIFKMINIHHHQRMMGHLIVLNQLSKLLFESSTVKNTGKTINLGALNKTKLL